MLLSRNPQRKEKKADTYVPPVSQDYSFLEDKEGEWIVWLGHACFLIQLAGIRILIDPQLVDMPLVPRRFALPFEIHELRGIDYLLLSHDHRDHTDKETIRNIVANNMLDKICCLLGLSKTIYWSVALADDARGFQETPIEEAAWYQVFDTRRVRITFLPTRHWCRRGLTDFNRSLWGSFMIERKEVYGESAGARSLGAPAPNERSKKQAGQASLNTIYFGGDSAATPYWKEIGKLFPAIDVAMLGIGAYAPSFMMQSNHANPAEAYQGFLDLGARYLWPMHYGTYDLSWEPAGEPIRWLRDLMKERPERLVDVGVSVPWGGRL